MALVASDINDVEVLEKELAEWETTYNQTTLSMNTSYLKKMEDFRQAQATFVKKNSINRKVINSYDKCYKRLKNSIKTDCFKEKLEIVSERLKGIEKTQETIEIGLPKAPSWFLRQCIGDVNVSLYWNKIEYKKKYESFKLKITIIGLTICILNWLLIRVRFVDCLFNAFLLWFFSSLTIQEQILVANGSNIRSWWRLHHYLSVLCCGVVMIWPDGEAYESFRSQLYIYSIYQGIVQIQQYIYQHGLLYRLRALGLTSGMSISTDGGHPIIWKKFSFLLVTLLTGYIFQFYNSYVLLNMYFKFEYHEWQILMLGILFNIIFFGNLLTLFSVLIQKPWFWRSREKIGEL